MSKERDHISNKELRKIKWRTDFDKQVIVGNFKTRKWTEGNEDDEGDSSSSSSYLIPLSF